jgi:mono/diheme cytochrome c family protein
VRKLKHEQFPVTVCLAANQYMTGNQAAGALISFTLRGPQIERQEHAMKKLAVLALIAVWMVAGCKVSSPGKAESKVVKEIKKSLTIGDKDVKNPIAYSDAVVKEGGFHFQHHCQICHGLDGRTTGVPFAEKMSPPVPDLSIKDIQDYTDGQLRFIIANGIEPSGMPAWKGILEDDEMWKIVHYIRHLPPKGSLGVPDVFKEEAEEHEQVRQTGQPSKKQDESKPHTHKHSH